MWVPKRIPQVWQRFYATATTKFPYSPARFTQSLEKNIPAVSLAFDKHCDYEPSTETPRNNPLIILHGVFGSKTNNRTVAKILSRDLTRDVYCLDLRNHGDSEKNERHDYASMASDVEKFIKDKIEPGLKPVLVGHSMGGKAAIATALRSPELLSALVCVDSGPFNYEFDENGKFVQYAKKLLEITSDMQTPVISRSQADDRLAQIEPALGIRQFLLTNLKRKSNQEIELEQQKLGKIDGIPVFESKIPLEYLMNALSHGEISIFPFSPDICQWEKPTLMIRGTKSNYIKDEDLPIVEKFFKHFEVQGIDSGHWVISEKPKEFITVLEKWIKDNKL